MEQLKLIDLPGYEDFRFDDKMEKERKITIWLPDKLQAHHTITFVRVVNNLICNQWARDKKKEVSK